MNIEYRKISTLKKLDGNPRTIKSESFINLCKSIKDNPDYFNARPLILSNRTGELVIIAGNQRYDAAIHNKLKEVPTFLIEGLDEAKEREIIIRDNVNNGEWDYEVLSAWDEAELEGWGVEKHATILRDGKEIEVNEEYEPALELGIEKEYLMIVFENKEQHQDAIIHFNLQKQREVNNKKTELNNVGIQRVIKYEDLCSIIK